MAIARNGQCHKTGKKKINRISHSQMNRINSILTGDALRELQKLPDNFADCCVTSPPYYGLRRYYKGVCLKDDVPEWVIGELEKLNIMPTYSMNIYDEHTIPENLRQYFKPAEIGLEDTPEAYIAQLRNVFREVWRLLKADGTLWVNMGDSYCGGKGYSGSSAGRYQSERRKAGKSITHDCSCIGGKGIIRHTDCKHARIKPKDLIGIPWMLAFALRFDGWYLRQDIIWHKSNPMPESVTDRCTKSHEYIFLLSKSRKYYFDHQAIMEPAAYDGRKDKLYKGGRKDMAGGAHERWQTVNGVPVRNKRDVWTVNTEAYRETHFATYPPALIAPCIKASCPEGGTVLDPFMGAGTTAMVARKLNRNFIGIELNPEYVKIAEQRLKEELGMFK
jgi:DNA modification methylase